MVARMPIDEPRTRDDVVVEEQHDVRRCLLKTCFLRRCLAAVLDEDRLQPRVVRCELSQVLVGSVRAAVNYHDHLPGGPICEKRPEDVWKKFPSVVRRHNYRDGGQTGRVKAFAQLRLPIGAHNGTARNRIIGECDPR